MAGFLYYLPGLPGVNEKALKKAGLLGLCRSGYIQRQVAPGPDKKQGSILIPKSGNPDARIPKPGYFPDRQIWQAAAEGAYWIGYEKEDPVKPEDIQEREFISGYEIKLGDGNRWTIPVARLFDQGTTLPESLILGSNGEIVKEVLPRYAEFGHMADHLWQILNHTHGDGVDEPEPLPDDKAYEYCTEALSINYNINKWGISVLRLLTSDNMISILNAIVDFPALKRMAAAAVEADKKKSSVQIQDTSGSSDGNGDSSEDTIPPLQTAKSSASLNESE